MSRGASTTILEQTETHPYGLSAHPAEVAMEMELDPQPTKTHPSLNHMNTVSESISSSQMPPPPLSSIATQSLLPSGSQFSAPPYTFTPLLTGQRTIVPQRPHPTDDLLPLFNLNPLVSTVTRINPITGNKENKLRRSYENQLKPFALCGRNKAVKHEENTPGGLLELIDLPDEDWQNTQVMGKETSKGLSTSTQARLDAALRMEPGVVPRDQEWQNILGIDRAKEVIPIPPSVAAQGQDQAQLQGGLKRKQGEAAPGQPPTKQVRVNGTFTKAQATPVVNTPPANEAARPKRVAKKRRYDEDSYAGYGEGYVDDELDRDVPDRGGGYDSDEGSRLSRDSKKKRKKDRDYPAGGLGGGGPPTSGMVQRTGSYGVGMIGVGSGYGR